MSTNQKYLLVSLLLFIYFLLEYTWIPWDEKPIYFDVPFLYTKGPVRLDSWVYNASVKLEHVVVVLILHILLPFKRETKLMLISFGLAVPEFFLDWNMPIAKIPLPIWYIPISTSPLKLASICYLMYAAVKKLLDE